MTNAGTLLSLSAILSANVSKILLVVLGPTASGKTALAIRLAQHFGTEIVSADSRQVFREMRIGTARPDESEWEGIPHHLLGHHSIHDVYNAGLFEQEAIDKLNAIFEKSDIAILCGGTGLYINAVLEGFDDVPSRNDLIRSEITASYEEKGLHWLQETLKEHDPDFYEHAEIHNPQRLIRAIEVVRVTGKTHAEIRLGRKKERPWKTIKIGIDLPREELYKRIDQRVLHMMREGLEEEAKNLLPNKELNALQTVGYTEIFEYLEGQYSRERAIELISQHTRNYAKRQLTWFRRDAEIHWVKADADIQLIESLLPR